VSAEQSEADESDASTTPEEALLREENQRLRAAYRRTKHAQHRRTAYALALVGVAALAGAVVFPSIRETLLVLAAIGVFGGVVTRYLTPEHVLTASVSDAVYDAYAETGASIVSELGLQGDRVYVSAGDGSNDVRVFSPKHRTAEAPEEADSVFLVDDDAQGVALSATGVRLHRDLADQSRVEAAADPGAAIETVADAVVEVFELADAVDVERDDGRVTVTVTEPRPADVSRFDHPIVSVFAVALVRATGAGVECTARSATDDTFTLTWVED
jgi:hypothetical protein